MDPRSQFARIFGGAAGVGDAGVFYEPARRVGEHHFGSPAMQSLIHDGSAGRSVNYNQDDAGAPLLAVAQTSMAQIAPAPAPLQFSPVDQYGNKIGQNPPLPQGEQPPPSQAPAGAGASGTSTTTYLLLGGAAFVAVFLVMKGRKK